ncbi:MAG: hypothetical protein HQL62_09830 [Magnetococcales bacterium]|nr:hypothetical protein [Magnetococcales bacterium]
MTTAIAFEKENVVQPSANSPKANAFDIIQSAQMVSPSLSFLSHFKGEGGKARDMYVHFRSAAYISQEQRVDNHFLKHEFLGIGIEQGGKTADANSYRLEIGPAYDQRLDRSIRVQTLFFARFPSAGGSAQKSDTPAKTTTPDDPAKSGEAEQPDTTSSAKSSGTAYFIAARVSSSVFPVKAFNNDRGPDDLKVMIGVEKSFDEITSKLKSFIE